MKLMRDTEFQGDVTQQEYSDFQRFMIDHYDELTTEVKGKGFVTRERLNNIINNFCKTYDCQIGQTQIDAFIELLDNDSKIELCCKPCLDNG